jgi:hypothetical protein
MLILLALCCPLLALAAQASAQATAQAAADAAQTSTADNSRQAQGAPTTEPGPEYQLFDLLASKDQVLDIQTQLVNSLVSANPELEDYQQVVRQWSRQYLSWDDIRDGMAKVYRDNFTVTEIEQMISFYSSATGRKAVLLMPILFREGSAVGTQLALAHKPELIDMLREARSGRTPASQ